MNLNEVLFIGGRWPHLASINIRCVEVARRLGCDYCVNVNTLEQIPHRFKAFVCVKPKLTVEDLQLLSARGPVIWDIVDKPPPIEYGIAGCIASTVIIARLFEKSLPIAHIPHYHCNFEGGFNDITNTRPAWIGDAKWYPPNITFDHDAYDARGMTRQDVARTHRKFGIGLNLRADNAKSYFHSLYNSGLKLINCIGFGIPSISAEGDCSYREIGEHCTLFSNMKNCGDIVLQLQTDTVLRQQLQSRCIATADFYSIARILSLYRAFLKSL